MQFLLILSTTLFLSLSAQAHSLSAKQNLSVDEIYQEASLIPSGVKSYITIGNDSLQAQANSLHSFNMLKVIRSNKAASIIEVDNAALDTIGEINHAKFNRCAGYFFHSSLKEAQAHMAQMEKIAAKPAVNPRTIVNDTGFQNSRMSWGNGGGSKPDDGRARTDYAINQQQLVKTLTKQVEELNIRNSIIKLSSYKNRYYKSATGVAAAEWIASNAKKIALHRNDVSVELFKHTQWAQPSVIITIKGKSDEIIIVGGHLDSISSGSDPDAPGADDNASGISTWLEVLRVLLDNNYEPEKTIQFMGYAAEEVGLRGSNEIAKKYNTNNANVIGVVQLDMTNFKGAEKSIYLMTDYTNAEQNTFVGKLIDEYVKVPWGFDKCGYGCSDHASWHNQGFPASMPFEATMSRMNHNIHTPRDKIDLSGNNANHAVNFAKLALAFLVELDR